MSATRRQAGFAQSGQAQIYYEAAGEGPRFFMIHAGVADRRQWDHEFEAFADEYRVVRYDMRGYGRSEPAEGEFSHLDDLLALVDQVGQPAVLMGCSMGGGLALEYALTKPEGLRALIMVGSGPSGLQLDVEGDEARFRAAQEAWKDGDLERVAELEAQIWFDGMGRSPDQVNQEMRSLMIEMNRQALEYEAKQLGKRIPDSDHPAAERLAELGVPVLIMVGEHDEPYSHAAAEYMLGRMENARLVLIDDAAHLPNMDHPHQFQDVVRSFLRTVL